MSLFNVDIYSDILYLWHSKAMTTLPLIALKNYSPPKLLDKLKRILKVLIKDLIELFTTGNADVKNKVLVLVTTKNNFDAVNFLYHDDEFFFAKPMRVRRHFESVDNVINYRYKFFYDLLFPFFLYKYLKHTKNKYAKTYWDYSFNVVGLYEESVRWLNDKQPKAVLFSNDHTVEQRAMLNAAKKLNIPTIYIQHACVTEAFPPLNFDLSLLDGEDSLRKYRTISSIRGDVKKVGNAKAAKYLSKRNHSSTINTIGVCCNIMDSLDTFCEAIDFLVSEFPAIKIIIRLHPADNRSLEFSEKIEVSESKKENAFEFLQKVDCMIAGNSSIHLEAILLNVMAIYYRFDSNEDMYDYYGFVKNGLLEEADNLNEINNIISKYRWKRPPVYHRAKFYSECVDTYWEGQVQEKVKGIIKNYVQNGRKNSP